MKGKSSDIHGRRNLTTDTEHQWFTSNLFFKNCMAYLENGAERAVFKE